MTFIEIMERVRIRVKDRDVTYICVGVDRVFYREMKTGNPRGITDQIEQAMSEGGAAPTATYDAWLRRYSPGIPDLEEYRAGRLRWIDKMIEAGEVVAPCL
jgi:hypothetical protein